jgi:hypothetical protein
MMNRALIAVMLAPMCFIGGCAYTASYNPAYLAAARRPVTQPFDGKALILTSAQDDKYVYTGNPTSLTGGATSLTIPVGQILKESAVAAFIDIFKDGADAKNLEIGSSLTSTDSGKYIAIVTPKLVSYSYEYNQAKNLGFAITPTAVVVADVRIIDQDGNARFQKRYESGPVEGSAYMINMSPHEEISKVTHQAFYEIFSRAANDVGRETATAKFNTGSQ